MVWQKHSDAWAAAQIVAHVQAFYGVSERRICLALGVDRASLRYVSHKPDQAPLRLRIHDLAAARMRYGYFRIYVLLGREGWLVNHKALLSWPKGVSTASTGKMI